LAAPRDAILEKCGLACWLIVGSAFADLKVATLHPLMSDLASQVGGSHVAVVSLLKPGGDPHEFQPSPGDLSRIRDAGVILASGKGLEPYLPKLRDNLAPGQKIVEVGRTIPSVRISAGDQLFICCPAHASGGIDPHWWHSVSGMKRATRVVAEEFAAADPANASAYSAGAASYTAKLDGLDGWIRGQLARVSRNDRKLCTAHLAFGYLCRDYGFRALPVQGLSRESSPSPQYLAETINSIKREKVRAIFPENIANPKVLEAMVSQTGVKLGQTLIADGTGTGSAASYEGMMRQNVARIVAALAP
jgi:zinc/manganese transport system substrate-binding protein